MMLCTTTMILTAFQQEAFWKDTVDFFTTFLNSCGEVLEMIADAECGLAQLLADMISQPIWRNVVYWIALALLFIITGILLFLSVIWRGISIEKRYGQDQYVDCIHYNSVVDGGYISWRLYPRFYRLTYFCYG